MTQPSAREWLLLQSRPAAADFNMALDEALLESSRALKLPVLRFYSWTERAASFGYAQRYAEVEEMTLLRPLVRRPTAGGLVPHDADWTYSLVFSPEQDWFSLKAIDSYRDVHAWIQKAFASLGITTELASEPRKSGPGQCFVGYEQFDLLWNGRKIAGAAQRRKRGGLLIQGSVQPPPVPVVRAEWERAMCEVMQRERGLSWVPFESPLQLNRLATTLQKEKYSQEGYNRRR